MLLQYYGVCVLFIYIFVSFDFLVLLHFFDLPSHFSHNGRWEFALVPVEFYASSSSRKVRDVFTWPEIFSLEPIA